MNDFTLGGVTLKPPSMTSDRMTMLLWGASGCGKTSLASTLPGVKLWLQFDPQGTSVLGNRNDIVVADYSQLPLSKVQDFKEGGYMETPLINTLKQHPEIESVVVDSVTTYADMCLSWGVTSGRANEGKFQSTIEKPGLTGYGIRVRLAKSMTNMLLRATAITNRHCCFICHEGAPEKAKDGEILFVTLLLGGDMPTELPVLISEVWYMREAQGKRDVYVRPFQLWRPMRTRMFKTLGNDITFPLKYNVYDNSGEGINEWHQRWKEGGCAPIPLPR